MVRGVRVGGACLPPYPVLSKDIFGNMCRKLTSTHLNSSVADIEVGTISQHPTGRGGVQKLSFPLQINATQI